MKRLLTIFFTCLILIVATVQIADCEKIYTKKTLDNTVKRKGEVQVEESEDVINKKIYTLDLINSKIDNFNTIISNAQINLAEWEAIKLKVEPEADKVILTE